VSLAVLKRSTDETPRPAPGRGVSAYLHRHRVLVGAGADKPVLAAVFEPRIANLEMLWLATGMLAETGVRSVGP
jgi:hypothetical protein